MSKARAQLEAELTETWLRVYVEHEPPPRWVLEHCSDEDLEQELDRLNMILEMREIPRVVETRSEGE